MEILNSPDLRDGHYGRGLGSMPTVVVHRDSCERSRLIDTNQNSTIPKNQSNSLLMSGNSETIPLNVDIGGI